MSVVGLVDASHASKTSLDPVTQVPSLCLLQSDGSLDHVFLRPSSPPPLERDTGPVFPDFVNFAWGKPGGTDKKDAVDIPEQSKVAADHLTDRTVFERSSKYTKASVSGDVCPTDLVQLLYCKRARILPSHMVLMLFRVLSGM